MATQPQGTEWMGDWNSISDQFWSAWRQGAASFGGAVPGNPAMDQWQRMLEQARGAQGSKVTGPSEMFERGMDGMRQYVDFMQNALQQVAAQSGTAFDPTQLMHGAFRSFDVRQNPVLSALRASAGHGALNVDQLLDGVKQFTEPFRQQLASGMSIPAFGEHREVIERNQALATAMVDLQEPMALYQGEMLKAAKRGLEVFELKLAERSEPGRELSSLRAVYDLWIDAAEEGYAEVALSPGFRKAYGAMANAQMRVRQLIQQQVERSTAAFGMPGRTEMDSVLRQLHDLRRRLGDAEEALATRDRAAPSAARTARKTEVSEAAKPSDGQRRTTSPRRASTGNRRTTKADRRSAVAAVVEVAAARKAEPKRRAPKQKAKVGKPTKSMRAAIKPAKSKKAAKADKGAGTFAERLAAARTTSRKGK